MTPLDTVALHINGERHSGCAPSSLTIDIIRSDPGLLGTKMNCKTGVCGACTVLLDGLPVLSCKVLAGSAQERSLTTIEGLAKDPENARLFAAFAFRDFPGCGDCVAGFVVSAKALLDADPAPDATEIKLALAGNLCRCVSPEVFIDAVLIASGQRRADPAPGLPAPDAATGIAETRLPQLPDRIRETAPVATRDAHLFDRIDRDAIDAALCAQQVSDGAARRVRKDPLPLRLGQIENAAVADTVAEAAKAFDWDAKRRARIYDREDRYRPGIGWALEGTVAAEGSAAAVFIDLHVDTGLGIISLGDCVAAVIAGSEQHALVKLAAQTGFAYGIETALLRVGDDHAGTEPDRYGLRNVGPLDIPRVTYMHKTDGGCREFSFVGVSGLVAAATVAAIANAVRDATGLLATALPISVGSRREN